MSMYNFIKYSDNYSKTSGSLWQYDRDEPALGNVLTLLLILLLIMLILLSMINVDNNNDNNVSFKFK